jgi:hypothetical protein
MARKSLVQRVEVEQAKKAHNCQASQKHRLQQGDTRLKVYNDRSADHYCLNCALAIVEADIAKLQSLGRQLRGEEPLPVKVDS